MITHKPINVSDERLAEMTKLRKETQADLAAINAGREAIKKERADFDTYKAEQEDLIKREKAAVKLESDNLDANLKAFEARVSQWEQEHMHQ